MKPPFLSFLFAACVLAPLSAQADIVRLSTGENVFGQGWRFLDNDGACKVVTARHVVVGADGALLPTLAIDGKKREASAGQPAILSDDPALDVAVLSLPSQNDPLICGNGRLSEIGVARRAHADKGLLIETTGESEVVTVPVERRAERMDKNNGEIFAVAPLNAADKFAKGWSGSVIRDVQGPIGIVFSVDPDRNEANAVRIDAVRRLMKPRQTQVIKVTAAAEVPNGPLEAQATAQASSPALPQTTGRPAASVTSLVGSTLDPAKGPDKIFGDEDSYWLVKPARHAISFIVAFNEPRPLHTVTVSYKKKEETFLKSLEIRTSAGASGDDWVPMGSCPADKNKQTLSCTIIGATVQRVQIILPTSDDDPVKLSQWKAE